MHEEMVSPPTSGRCRLLPIIRPRYVVPALLLATLAGLVAVRLASSAAPSAVSLDDLYAEPLAAPAGPLRVYHLGHSLVGRDMPEMLAQLAGAGHRYESQLGWGATLRAHWGDDAVAGFGEENAHPRFRPSAEAVDSGDYDAVVLTEMVEIRSAIRYHQSTVYLRRWSERIAGARPDTRIFLYETWHQLDDAEGWLNRLDLDLGRYWEEEILGPAQAAADLPDAIRVIPAGQVLASFVRNVEARGGIEGISTESDLFRDTIHLNDLGAYLVALTHYAVLYQKSPVGLPRQLRRADGSLAEAPAEETALLMQQIVWDVVTGYPKTGVPQSRADSNG